MWAVEREKDWAVKVIVVCRGAPFLVQVGEGKYLFFWGLVFLVGCLGDGTGARAEHHHHQTGGRMELVRDLMV